VPQEQGAPSYDAARQSLICEQSQLVYRVEEDIPVLLVEEAEPLSSWRKRHGLNG